METRADNLATKRLKIFIRACLIWGVLIFGRLILLQVWKHNDYSRLAQRQQDKHVELQAPRGAIIDRNGRHLAMSLPVDSVCINPLRVPDLAVAAEILSRVLDLDQAELLQRMATAADNHRGFMWVKRKITPQESERLRSYNLGWIEFRTESRRFYPKGQLASHVVGSVDHEESGNSGLELSLDKELSGRSGLMRTTSDVKGGVVDMEVFAEPQPGKNITLSIDERIQFVAERELQAAAEVNKCKTGSLVVMNPNTGEILAMANYPSFDPNEPLKPGETLSNRLNLAVSAPFEPGSVFKVITLAAALETTRLTPDTIIPCGNGRITLFRRVIHDHDPYSALSMADVLAKSSNIGAIQVGLAVGNEKMYEYVQRFGFGRPTGLGLPGESAGVTHPLRKWIASSIGSVAMGHELSTTTVQLARACSVVANGGLLVKPRLTLKRQRPGNAPDPNEPGGPPVRVIQAETAIKMRQMMERVVLKGTGTKARIEGYSAGGKTGSAQIYDFQARAYTHKYNASFMGFAPVNNPSLVVVVTLNGASKYGGAVAAPVFHQVASAALRMLEVPKDLPDGELPPGDESAPVSDAAIADLGAGGGMTPADEAQTALAASGLAVAPAAQPVKPLEVPTAGAPAPVAAGQRAPNYVGKTLRDVVQESARKNIRVEYSGRGIARRQDPLPGSLLRPGEIVKVQFER